MDSPSIALQDVRKSFGNTEVLRGIDLQVQPGTILGYVGPNGAGKTTTVRILCGLQPSFEGEVTVGGLDVRLAPTEVKALIGYVPENAVLYEPLTIAEFLLFVGRLHGLEDDLIRRRADVFLDTLDLASRLNSKLNTLSKGMRQKVLLTGALLHDPKILFVDEPLSGLDVNAAILVKDLLRGLADRGRTVFYCSHVMDVVERICDRIVIIDDGVIAAQGTFEELSAQMEGGSLESIFARLTAGNEERACVDTLLDALEDAP